MRSTIKDIAKALDVNVGTVSRALNDKPGVSAKLRKKIVRKAADLSYRPNGHARGLVTQRTETIGLLSGVETAAFLLNPFYAGVFIGIEGETRRNNYALMFASAVEEEDALAKGRLPKFIMEHRVDGILVVGAVEADILEHLQASPYPFVLVDYHLPTSGMDTVVTDNRRGGRLATEHLLKMGHKHIAFVGGAPLDHGNFWERLQGYQEALEARGIKYREELVQGGELVGGYKATLDILDREPRITAVVACNDANALAAVAGLASRKLRVPEDVSVVGYDDIASAAEATPPLTTMRVDKCAMGQKAAQRLIDKLKAGGEAAPHETTFPAELIVRQSTAAPRK